MTKSDSPKVAFFLPSLGGGGAEMHALRIANASAWDDRPPVFLLSRHGGRFEEKLRPGREIVHLLPRWVRSSALSMVLSVGPLRSWLERERPDVVFSFLNHTTVVLARALSAMKHRPIVIVGLQNNFSVERSEWQGLRGRWFARAVRAAHRSADALVALSHGVADDYHRVFPDRARPHVIPNAGYDDHLLSQVAGDVPARAYPEPGVLRIVACGRLTEQKDYPLLFDAFHIASKTRPVELLILGEGHLRGALERKIGELGLQERIHLVGFQTMPAAFVSRAHLFVLSSAWEGFGNVIVEAMAVGTPVVSMDCPFGPSEIIRDRVDGRLVKERTPEALASVLGELLDNESLRRAFSQAGRIRALAFHPEGIAQAYRSWMAEVLATPRPALGTPG